MNQSEYIGPGSIKALSPILEELSPKKIFLVVGRNSYSACEAKDFVESVLSDYEITIYNDFSINPNMDDLQSGIPLFSQADPDVVVAIGGGSVIDMAKMVNYFASNHIAPADYIAGCEKSGEDSKPLIAVPTTAGTGTESTHFAVLNVGHVKHSVVQACILPDFAIVDPSLTMSMPPRLAAISGMDALSQAIESYWNINSNAKSKSYASEAISLIISNLASSVNDPTLQSRDALAQASHLAGKAINITKTTAPHAVSYPLTSYFGIPHGHAVALTLSSFLAYNYQVDDSDVIDERGADYVRRSIEEITNLLGASEVSEAKQIIDELMFSIGLETKLSKLGIHGGEDIQLITDNGFNPDRVKNNPRALTPEALSVILHKIL